jgi:hypothetical protein
VADERCGRIVPEGLWGAAVAAADEVCPQGGGTANIDDQAVFAAIVYALVSGARGGICGLVLGVEVHCAPQVF